MGGAIKLDDGARQAVAAAVAEAESRTSGEIVPAVVGASDHYAGARWRLAVAIAFAVAALQVVLWPELVGEWTLLVVLAGGVLGHLCGSSPPLLRLALRRGEIDEEVRQRAYELFLENNVHATRDRTGVLLLVSVLERRIEVLGDTAVHAAAPDGYWQQVVEELGAAIKRGDLGAGMVAAIKRIGDLLAEKFPPRADNINELSDTLIEQR